MLHRHLLILALIVIISSTMLMMMISFASATLVVPTDRKPACLPPFRDTMPFCNTSLSIEERVADLISRIKTEDKPGLMTARGWPQGNLTGLDYLGVPAIDNGLNCVRSVQSTCVNGTCPTLFTNPTSLGASWNMDQVYDMAQVIGIEARSLLGLANLLLGPDNLSSLLRVGVQTIMEFSVHQLGVELKKFQLKIP